VTRAPERSTSATTSRCSGSHHILEPTTRESYRYNLDRHILPWFGPMQIGDILPIHVRQWVTELVAAGVSPATIRHQKIILSAVFTTALNDFIRALRDHGLLGSMGRVGACADNAAVDRTHLPPPTPATVPRQAHPDRV
jgi:hypothetical protein